jgi:osmotically-inducible protein OsmY
MKQVLASFVALVVAASLLAGCQTTRHNQDAQLKSAVQTRLAQSQLDISRVGVDAQNGAVYLSGTAPSHEQRARMEVIAREELARQNVSGQVVNRLQVMPPGDESAISSSIRSRMQADPLLSHTYPIGVETQHGVVALTGTVPSFDQRMRAEQIARETPGVTSVVNNIQVASASTVPPSPPVVVVPPGTTVVPGATVPPSTSVMPPPPAMAASDMSITAAVKERLAADRFANLMRVNVDTSGGIVYLNGVVPSLDHKIRAEQIARQVGGVTQVVNNLQVQP